MNTSELWDKYPGLTRYIKLKRPNLNDIGRVLDDFGIDRDDKKDRQRCDTLIAITYHLGKLPSFNRRTYVRSIIKIMELFQ